MILRKPYAFLIKNFKKIHIALLILSFFVAYRLIDVNSYVKEFMRLGTYDFFGDPITKHISFLLNVSLFLLIIGSAALLFLLRYKHKPWKIYLVPIIEYAALFFVLGMIKNFFNGYSSEIEATDVRLTRDLLMIFAFGQAATIGIFIMRVFGLDMKKFQFNSDEEFLQLSEADREEFEIGLNFDKHSIIRGVKRFIRNVKYVYLEHKLVFWVIGGILLFVTVFSTGSYLYVHKRSYSEGERYKVNGYTFQINNVYFTNKDLNGNVLSKKSNFVIVDLSITNHSESRTVYLENFHIKNGTNDYVTTKRTYAKEFQDFGVAYESTRKINKDESLDLIIVYKVSKNLKKDRFVLFYQEKSGILRKIKLKPKDVSQIKEEGSLNVKDEFKVDVKNDSDTLRVDHVELLESFRYKRKECTSSKCTYLDEDVTMPEGYTAMEIKFYSESYDAKNIIDFLKNYGKLNYRDSEDEEYSIDIENATPRTYGGKTIYLKVPVDVETAKRVYLDITMRNRHFTYDLLGGLDDEE